MPFETVRAPHVNVNDLEVLLVEWHVKPWQQVSKGAPLCTVETTKSVLAIDSPAAGFVYPVATAGAAIKVGEPLAHLFPSADPKQVEELHAGPAQASAAVISRKARELMERFGLKESDFPPHTAVSSDTVVARIRELQAAAPTAARGTPAQVLERLSLTLSSVLLYGEPNQALLALDVFGPEAAAAFMDDGWEEEALYGLPALGTDVLPALKSKGLKRVFICGRDRPSNETALRACDALGLEVVSAVHPSASVSRLARLGRGVFVGALAAVGPDVELDDFSRVLCCASVAHHSRVGRFASITDGARLGGNVTVGDEATIGLNASVNKRVSVGKNCIVVSGASVADHVPDNHIVRHDGSVAPRPVKRGS